MMRAFKEKETLALIATVFLSGLAMGGCATTSDKATAIKYSYDMKTSFSERKSYAWGPPSFMYRQDPLLETNVRALADQLLAQKGFTRMPEKSDLTISMSYEFEYGKDLYQLRMLNLNIYNAETKGLVWRGTALGAVNTDAASGNLKQAVQGILSNFPPN